MRGGDAQDNDKRIAEVVQAAVKSLPEGQRRHARHYIFWPDFIENYTLNDVPGKLGPGQLSPDLMALISYPKGAQDENSKGTTVQVLNLPAPTLFNFFNIYIYIYICIWYHVKGGITPSFTNFWSLR